MGIVGAVLSNPTVSANTATAETATFPQANMTIVKIVHSATYITIPIDSTRTAVLPATGGIIGGSATVATQGTGRLVTFTVNGTVLNYTVKSVGTTPVVVFYYGTPIAGSKPLTAYAGVIAQSTLSTGSGSGTWNFPSGPLKLTGVTAGIGQAAASTAIQIAWNTSSGQSMNVFVVAGSLSQTPTDTDIFPTDLTVSQQVTLTLSGGTGSDVVYAYAFYA